MYELSQKSQSLFGSNLPAVRDFFEAVAAVGTSNPGAEVSARGDLRLAMRLVDMASDLDVIHPEIVEECAAIHHDIVAA